MGFATVASCAQAKAGEAVVVELPEDVQPGISEVEVDVSGSGRLRVVVPDQARPLDRLVLEPRPGGEWDCSLVRGSGGATTPTSQPSCPAKRREITAIVPEGAQGGKTQLAVDVGGEKLLVTAPEGAQTGDRLTFSEGADGEWQCRLERPRLGGPDRPGTSSRSGTNGGAGRPADPCELRCQVPFGAVPGKTMLRLAVGTGSVIITVPDDSLPGDELIVLVRGDGSSAVARADRGGGESARGGDDQSVGASASAKSRHSVTMTRMSADPEIIHAELVEALRLAPGAFISPKIKRGAAPPVNIIGMVACGEIAKDEELVRIPSSLFLSIRRCRELYPELSAAVGKIASSMKGREAEAFHAVCLAKSLRAAELHGASPEGDLDFSVSSHAGEDALATWRVWGAYAKSLLCESFDEHPYWRAMNDPDETKAMLAPSPEHEYMDMMAGDVVAMYQCLSRHVPEHLLGPRLDLGIFLQARLCVLTRVFQLDGDSCMVPVNDCFNHSADPGLTWSWDEDRKNMVLTAARRHEAGEELFISYGKRSNVLLFRTYGFTLPPEVEPDWTFMVQGGARPADIFARYLPPRHAKLYIHLGTQLVQQSLVVALNACKDHGADPEEFLRALCARCRRPYDGDPGLRGALEALRRAREAEPAGCAWWDHLPPEAAPASGWPEHALRVRMSEYLCLTAHLEILDVMAGRMPEEHCLEGPRPVRKVLLEGLQILRQGARLALNTYDTSLPSVRGLAPG